MVLWNFAGTKLFERYKEENVIGRNVIERFYCISFANILEVTEIFESERVHLYIVGTHFFLNPFGKGQCLNTSVDRLPISDPRKTEDRQPRYTHV